MSKHTLSAAQLTDTGQLRVNVVSAVNNYPISDAVVSISYGADPEDILEEVSTDLSGQTDTIALSAPPLEYSLEPSEQKSYADYTITVRAPGFEPLVISGSEVLSGSLSIQPARLTPMEPDMQEEDINIPDHTLYGDYPQKIPEDEIKPVSQSGEIVLSRPIVSGKHLRKISDRTALQSADNAEKFITTRKTDSFESLAKYPEMRERLQNLLEQGEKITPKQRKAEIQSLQKEYDSTSREKSKTVT